MLANYRLTDKHLRLVMTLIAFCCTWQSRDPKIDRCMPEIWPWPWPHPIWGSGHYLRQGGANNRGAKISAKGKVDPHAKNQSHRSNSSGVRAQTDGRTGLLGKAGPWPVDFWTKKIRTRPRPWGPGPRATGQLFQGAHQVPYLHALLSYVVNNNVSHLKPLWIFVGTSSFTPFKCDMHPWIGHLPSSLDEGYTVLQGSLCGRKMLMKSSDKIRPLSFAGIFPDLSFTLSCLCYHVYVLSKVSDVFSRFGLACFSLSTCNSRSLLNI